ncbi:MAG TPA: response regulator [Candidatus Acidoferrales bacterium]|jgi:CheY-like chemotaxis protein|nr:response regulator [Candidatus Acidoferrales bacterium]
MSTRLLIVDDHPNARDLIRGFLTMPGLTVQECASGHDALARVREFRPHWVTMDIQMPGLNGFETTRAIKEVHPDARVMIVTSFNDPHFRKLADSAGASGFILKENLLALRLMLEKETGNEGAVAGSSPNVIAGPKCKRILVLDDDQELRTTFSLLLSKDGYSVTQAYTGRDAITLHQKESYDLVVVELLLPDNQGIETLTELRKLPSPPKTIATARPGWMPTEVYSKMARQLGVHGTLPKPFQPEQLLALVKDVLDS